MYIDLQLHSTYSDGALTPTQMAGFLKAHGVKVASLTDHNTVAGLDEFFNACNKVGIKAIPGVELYVKYGVKKLNFLFYNFDKDNPDFHSFLRETQMQRYKNVAKALKFWQKRGGEIDIDKTLSKYNHYIPINGIVKTIIKNKNNVRKIEEELGIKDPHEWEIVKHYFKNRNIYYLSETYINFDRLHDLHKKIGGQVILGHPGKQRVKRELISKLAKEKLIDGVEILSPHHGFDAISYYQHILKDTDMIFAGGSDFHGRCYDYSVPINCSWDYFKIDTKNLHGVEKIIG